ncbi:MAG: hypothetical protein K2J77_00035 [Oscillospiraceae bacterium]|nr:hypothetical protein [Oscillospiraceae bacterium]
MNLDYLNSLPEEKNKFKVQLGDGEKVVFIAKGVIFGTETGRALGYETKVTLTNKRLIADNGRGVWTAELAGDFTGYSVVDRGKGLLKEHFVQLDLKEPVVCGDSREQITVYGYIFVFKKKDEPRFLEIAKNIFV